MARNDTIALPASLTQLLSPNVDQIASNYELAGLAPIGPTVGFPSEALKATDAGIGALRIGLIDCHQFSRECLMTAIESHHPNIVIIPFSSVDHFIDKRQHDLDVVIYYPHTRDTLEDATVGNIGTISQLNPNIPLVLLSDIENERQPTTINAVMNSGAHGFIPTRTTGILIAIAAIRFVKAGGTFAPLDQLLANRPPSGQTSPETVAKSPLTSRQAAVLSHLQQGKANKIIAHELSMSESTVKVHIRNIMRKMGATNRTEAAFKARQFSDLAGVQ